MAGSRSATVALRIATRLVICRSRRARESRPARRSLCDLRKGVCVCVCACVCVGVCLKMRIASRLVICVSCASRAGVALRATVAMRPPRRRNGLPVDAHRCATNQLSSAPRVKGGRRIAARLVICPARRARGSRCAHRSLCGLRSGGTVWGGGLPRDPAGPCRQGRQGQATRPGRAAY